MSDAELDELTMAFARATALMNEARERLDALSGVEAAAQSSVSEARRMNSGLLQVLSVLHSAAEQALSNQTALEILTARIDAERDLGDNPAGPDLIDRLADGLAERVANMPPVSVAQGGPDLAEALDLLRNPPAPPWLPMLHQFVSGASALAAEGAVAPVLTAIEGLTPSTASVDAVTRRLEALDDKVEGLTPVLAEHVRSAVADHLASSELKADGVVSRLDALEQAVTAVGAKREALPKTVIDGLSHVSEKIDDLGARNAVLGKALTAISAKQSSLDKKLAQIDDLLMEMAKDIEDVHAVAYAAREAGGSETDSSPRTSADDDGPPQRYRRSLFKS